MVPAEARVDRWAPQSGLPPILARRIAMRQELLKNFEPVAALVGQAAEC